MNNSELVFLAGSALQGIISNEETMREVTKLINDNPDKSIDFYSVIGDMAVKYAKVTLKNLQSSE